MSELKGVIPAIRNYKDFERALESNHKYIIFLETRISQIGNLVRYAKQKNKKVLVHTDLIQGLKADEFGMEYLLHELKVDGIISTRGNVISIAKKHGILAVQRLFVLDSHALDHNIKIMNNVKPDYIEVLPGLVPKMIKEINERTGLPIVAGGLIRTKEDIQNAYDGGAMAVTTSRTDLW
ncbi:glycerol-3-phosphate responsive antiterminator [Aquibacillus sp. 3ASR75-11]|uniref:Glycerol uptake operon antiterminator regulatory protein n=1 Tax=Terrihalobacillus insolitus TaxID=2950438 RepID=A0A9X3WQ54_9BACI|nr:glycerol-3-phosphate responsive antiterminator [Terrihalobacillus insolitus]MDC3412142.1 glycerol-3-phosphate responsive antiterminator [Terrihalobacillus insolitus]MDC3423165.1 glycerol-3-phosphate responsive antiterminator [Terrihalobacillus insolitus]